MINLKETKRIKEALEQQPQDFLSIIENTDLAICITNENGKFVAANTNYCKLYGYKAEELIGQPFTLVVPEENREALDKYHQRFFVDKYEILRKWVVKNRRGEQLEIFADAGYNEKINQKPHKITLIQFIRKVDRQDQQNGGYANSKV